MAITIASGDAENYRNIASDLTGFLPSAFRNALRFDQPLGAKTERCTISGGKILYKGHPVKFYQATIAGGVCFQSAAQAGVLADQLKSRGVNLVRLTHIDQTAANGILDPGVPDHWYDFDITQPVALAAMLKALRARGIWYCLDFNSMAGNTSATDITGTDASDMHVAATSIQLFKCLPPINAAADTQLKAYISNLLALDLGGGVTLANDPNFLYATITNEHLPDSGVVIDTDSQRVFDAWLGSAFSASTAAHRTAYGAACLTYLGTFRTWLTAQGCGAFLAWGSEFGTNLTEYDALKAAVDIQCIHLYAPHNGQVGEVLIPDEPQKLVTSITNIKLTNSAHALPRVGGPGTWFVEEFTGADPNRFKAEGMHILGIAAAANGYGCMGQFAWGDGAWTATTPPAPSQFQICGDRCRDASELLAGLLFLRGDLLPQAQWSASNTAYENRTTWVFGGDTERTISCTAPAGQGSGALQRGQSFSVLTGERATCFVTVFDPTKPIWESKRLLIAHITDVQRVNRVVADDWTAMTNTGNGATCIRKGTATIAFYSLWPNNVTVYRCLPDGTRGATMALSVTGNLVSFTADNSTTPTIFYEAVVSGVAA